MSAPPPCWQRTTKSRVNSGWHGGRKGHQNSSAGSKYEFKHEHNSESTNAQSLAVQQARRARTLTAITTSVLSQDLVLELDFYEICLYVGFNKSTPIWNIEIPSLPVLRPSSIMGWIRGLGPTKLVREPQHIDSAFPQTKEGVEHIEEVSSTPGADIRVYQQDPPKTGNKYPFQPSSIADENLPFIPTEEVVSKRRPGALSSNLNHSEENDFWIVVDNIVFDCSSFISDHPGGEQVILSFVGEDCSCMLASNYSMCACEPF